MKKSMGLIGSAYQLAFFLSPLLGGLIVSQLVLTKFLTAIFLTACSVAIAFLISFSLKDPQNNPQRPDKSYLVIFKEGVSELKKQ